MRENQVFRPSGACSLPLFYPQLTLWAKFLHRFAAETGELCSTAKYKSSSHAVSAGLLRALAQPIREDISESKKIGECGLIKSLTREIDAVFNQQSTNHGINDFRCAEAD